MDSQNRPIGFFDSGVGGISVLKEAVKLLPKEDFIYYGDSKNAPYGIKTPNEVKKLAFNAVDFLYNKGVKAVVVACNTATSVAIKELRNHYDIPIIGIEPALKPAVELKKQGKIIIMATPMTLSERKFESLMSKYEKEVDINRLPCAGLVEFIEQGIIKGEKINNYLKDKLSDYMDSKIACIVLGCTHYPFIKQELYNIVGSEVDIIDGSLGTARELKRKLEQSNNLNLKDNIGKVKIYNSKNDLKITDLSYKLLNLK